MKIIFFTMSISLVVLFVPAHAAVYQDIPPAKKFTQGMYSQHDEALIVGAGEKGADVHAVTKIMHGDGGVQVMPLVPAGSAVDGQEITSLALQDDRYPVVTVGDEKVHMLADGRIWSNIAHITDAAGNNIDKPVVAVAASPDYVFAVVSEQGKNFTVGDERGVALLQKNAGRLEVLDAANDVKNVAGDATKLSLALGDKVFAFTGDGAVKDAVLTARANAVCHWDDKLSRLFVGLSGLKRGDNAQGGGVIGVASGAITGNALALKPVLQADPAGGNFRPAKAQLYDNAAKNINDRVVGFYYDGLVGVAGGVVNNPGRAQTEFQVFHINTMHTTTGKSY